MNKIRFTFCILCFPDICPNRCAAFEELRCHLEFLKFSQSLSKINDFQGQLKTQVDDIIFFVIAHVTKRQ